MTKILIALCAAVVVLASANASFAARKTTPGHLMQTYSSVPGHPGASGYAPGHLKYHKHGYRH